MTTEGWRVCKYHEKVFPDRLARTAFYGKMCPDGDESFGNHCTVDQREFTWASQAVTFLNEVIRRKPR